MNVCNNIAQKVVEVEFLFFASNFFFNGSLITKKKDKKWGFGRFLAIFSKSFLYGTMKIGLQAYCG